MPTTIAVSNETKKKMLNMIGHKGETYDEIIRHTIDLARKEIFFERQEKILAKGDFVPLEEL